jgi:hypothetical protein
MLRNKLGTPNGRHPHQALGDLNSEQIKQRHVTQLRAALSTGNEITMHAKFTVGRDSSFTETAKDTQRWLGYAVRSYRAIQRRPRRRRRGHCARRHANAHVMVRLAIEPSDGDLVTCNANATEFTATLDKKRRHHAGGLCVFVIQSRNAL